MRKVSAVLRLLMVLGGALVLAAWSATPPAVVRATAPSTSFSAARAMKTVAQVSFAPHQTGSPAAAAVRDRLATRLQGIGPGVVRLTAVGVDASSVHSSGSVQAGRVETLVATLVGRRPDLPAIAIMAHTDSVPDSPGAGDDGVGVAVAIETVRAIAAGRRPVRTVMLILTDGEEAGLLGAHAFFADPARAAMVGAIVNIDARGTAGLGTMFETGPASGGLVALYRTHGTHRFAHSAATFLYHQLPNRTDLTAARATKIPALNFAFLDGQFDYHTPRDRLASVDPRTVQSLGDQILPVVRAAADRPTLPPTTDDGVFGDVPGIVALRYPAWVGWPLLALTLAGAAWASRGARLRPTLRAMTLTLGIGAAAALAARLGYALTGVGDDWGEHHRIMAAAARYEAALGLATLACLVVGAWLLRRGGQRWLVAGICLAGAVLAILLGRPPLSTAILALVAAALALAVSREPIGAVDLRAGTLAVGLLVSLVAQGFAPPLTPVVLWPTAAATLAAVAGARSRTASALIAILPIAYLLAFAHAVILALGIPSPEVVGVFAIVAVPLIAPLVTTPARWLGAGAAIVAAILWLSFRWMPATERFPELSQVYAVLDEHGRSWRVSPLERPGNWTVAALGGGKAMTRTSLPSVFRDPVWQAPAAAHAVTPPRISVAREGDAAAVTVIPSEQGREMRLRMFVDRPLRGISVEGVAIAGFAGSRGMWRLRWQSPGQPVTLRFSASAGTRLVIEAAETSEKRLALPRRPATVVPWLGSDRTIAVRRFSAIL